MAQNVTLRQDSRRHDGRAPGLYETLDHSRHQIRVLKVLPTSGDRIQCEMQVTDLAHLRREYTCLSYVWGDEPADHSIKINGITVGIRTNLLDFLRVAVSRYASQWLWIDALCIDQNCPLERNHQVRQMAQIYSRAARVLAWLGRGSGRAMDQAPYWNRMWIKQELMLNRNVLLLYGLESISLQNFITNLVHGNSRLRDANPRPQNKPADNPMQNTRRFEEAVVHVPGMSPAEGTCLLVQDFQRSKSYPLTKLVFWFMDAGCKDPRDKVYALVALASDALEDFVDYQRSVVGVYCKTLTMWHDKTAALWDIVSFAVDLADNMCLKSTALYTQPRYTTCIHEVKLITVGAIDACKQPLRFHVHTTWSKLREQLSQSSNLTNSLTSYFDDRSESQSIGTRNGTQFLVFIDARDEIINRSDDDHADRTIFIARQTQGSLKHICFGFKPIWYSHDSNNLEYSRFQRRAERFSYPTKGNYTFVRLLPTVERSHIICPGAINVDCLNVEKHTGVRATLCLDVAGILAMVGAIRAQREGKLPALRGSAGVLPHGPQHGASYNDSDDSMDEKSHITFHGIPEPVRRAGPSQQHNASDSTFECRRPLDLHNKHHHTQPQDRRSETAALANLGTMSLLDARERHGHAADRHSLEPPIGSVRRHPLSDKSNLRLTRPVHSGDSSDDNHRTKTATRRIETKKPVLQKQASSLGKRNDQSLAERIPARQGRPDNKESKCLRIRSEPTAMTAQRAYHNDDWSTTRSHPRQDRHGIQISDPRGGRTQSDSDRHSLVSGARQGLMHHKITEAGRVNMRHILD